MGLLAATSLVACSSSTTAPPHSTTQVTYATVPSAAAGPTTKVGYFYHPPDDPSQNSRIVNRIDWLVFHHDDSPQRVALTSAGYHHPVFMYLLAMQTSSDHWDNNALWGQSPDPSNPNSSYFDDALKQHPDWFLHDQYGQLIKSDYYWMDPGSPGWRQFLATQARSALTQGWGGIFLDNLAVTFKHPIRDAALNTAPSGATQGSPVPWNAATNTAYTNESFGDQVGSLIATVHQLAGAPTGKPIWANLTDPTTSYTDQRAKYQPSLDGWMDEGFASTFEKTQFPTVDQWNTMMSRADVAPTKGKSQILVGQGGEHDRHVQRFTFASYLLVQDARTIFRYALTTQYRSLWWYPDYDADFGAPKGPRYQLKDGSWRRDYAHGYVEVNPASHDVTLVVDGTQL